MNLHGQAAGVVAAVNPLQSATVQISTGYETDEDGSRTPSYSTLSALAQVQPLGVKDLQKMSGLNIQGVSMKAYLSGNYEGCFRKTGKGGDLLTIGALKYLVVAVLERWPDWTAVAIQAQVD